MTVPAIRGISASPEWLADRSAHRLEIDRQVDRQADIGAHAETGREHPHADHRVVQHAGGNQRLDRRLMRQPNSTQNNADRATSARIGARAPRIAQAAPAQREQDRHGRGDQQDGAEQVELVRPLVARQPLQAPIGDQERQQSERQVDPEDHRPVQMLGEKAAQHRPGEARGHEHAGEIDLIAAALPGRHEIGHDGLREGDQPPAAEALQAARQDQKRASRAPARRRSSRR